MRYQQRISNAFRRKTMVSKHIHRSRYFFAIESLAGALLHAQRSTEAPSAKSFSRVDGVQYLQGASAPLLADIYLPKGKGKAPAIIFMHGGGWTEGQRTSWNKLIEPFAEHGYVGMTIDYDLSPAVRFPVALEECKAAVRWLRAHAAEYGVDPGRIAVADGSAGGEPAALVCADRRRPSLRADFCFEASPQFHLGGNLSPIFIGHGTADRDVPYSQFTHFVTAYTKAHGPMTTYTAEQGSHSCVGEPEWFQANVDATLSFLQQNL